MKLIDDWSSRSFGILWCEGNGSDKVWAELFLMNTPIDLFRIIAMSALLVINSKNIFTVRCSKVNFMDGSLVVKNLPLIGYGQLYGQCYISR